MPRATKGRAAGGRARRVDELGYQLGGRAEPDKTHPPTDEQESASAAPLEDFGATAAVKGLCDLALDSIACIEAITASWTAGVPYTGLREVMRFNDAQKAEITEAVRKVAVRHAAAFVVHKDAIELGVVLTAMQTAQIDQVLLLASGKEPLSGRQLLGTLAIIFTPLLALLVLVWLSQLYAEV